MFKFERDECECQGFWRASWGTICLARAIGIARLIVLRRRFGQTKGILRPKNGLRMTGGGCMANGMCVPFYCFQEETLHIKRLWIAQWQEILGASDGLAYAAQEFLKVGVAFY